MEIYKIDKILMPTDFSELSACAFKVAVDICKRHQAKLTLLHIVDNMYYMTAIDANAAFVPSLEATESEYIKSNRKNLEESAKELSRKFKIDIDTIVEMGNPADTICRVASKNNFDLIVMGTHGASGLREFFMGSTAFQVVKNSRCPVLTIPGNWNRTEFKKVIFPIRMLPGAIDKYDYARPIIEKNDSSVHIVGLLEKEDRENMDELLKLIDDLEFHLLKKGVEFSSNLYQAKDFPQKVIETSVDIDADLIVITANLDYDLKAFFMGPFSQQIVNHSHRPVLSIRATMIEEVNKNIFNESYANWQSQYLQFGL